jgi:DNA-binding NtrC family response regulator
MSCKILVVDDEPRIADTLATIFQRAGYNASAVYSGDAAISWIDLHQPLLVVSDVVMPGMDGLQLAKLIRASYPGSAVLLFSGNADTQGLLERARTEGHDFEVLAKPVPPTLMLAKVALLAGATGLVS